MNIAVLYQRPKSTDRKLPLDSQGRSGLKHVMMIKSSLESLGHQAHLVDMNLDTYEKIKNTRFDLAFNLCDDGFRNNSLLEPHIPAMLDILQLSYTGSNFNALATCLNKARTKEILSFHGIATPQFQVFSSPDEKLDEDLEFPLIVKPVHEDGSIGVKKESVVNNRSQLKERVKFVIDNYKQEALVEKFIDGREVYVGILGNKGNLLVLPISEIIFDHFPGKVKICSYETKWVEESREYQNAPAKCPARLDKALERKLRDIAQKVYLIFECQDYARIDFRIDRRDVPYVLEVNPNPDLSEGGGLVEMAKVGALNYEQLIERIVASALSRNHLAKGHHRGKHV